MKKYDKMISKQVSKYVSEVDNLEDRAIIYLSVEKRAYQKSLKMFQHDSSFISLLQSEYQEKLLETWSKRVPAKALTR